MQPIRKRTYCSLTREFTMCVSFDGGRTFYSNRAIGVARRREAAGLNPLTGESYYATNDTTTTDETIVPEEPVVVQEEKPTVSSKQTKDSHGKTKTNNRKNAD